MEEGGGGDRIGDAAIGEKVGDVGEYDGDVGEYDGDVGERDMACAVLWLSAVRGFLGGIW